MNSQKFYSTLRACLAALLLTVTLGVGAAPVAQAIWCSGNTTLYFTHDELYTAGQSYDSQTITNVWSGDMVTATAYQPDWDYDSSVRGNCTHVVFDPSFANVRPVSCIEWFLDFTELTAIEGLNNLNTSEVKSMYSMFANCSSLTSIDLSGFRTAEVTTMEGMFYSCDGLTTLDLSTFRTDKVKNMVEMFKDCTSLETIYVSSGWTTANVTSSSDMFTNCNGTLTTQVPTVVLNDNADNAADIAYFSGITINARLQGRTLTKEGYWNTLCLPFSMNAAQIAASDLAGATIKELDADNTSLSGTGVLTLHFNEVAADNDGNIVKSGMPYIAKWTNGDNINITDPVFSGVTISSTTPTEVESSDHKVKFVGQYSQFSINDANINEILYVASGNKIGYSKNPRTLKCFRAHFWVQPNKSGVGARMINIDYGDGEASGITTMNLTNDMNFDGAWYDLQGRKLAAKPTQHGVYIHHGRQVVVK